MFFKADDKYRYSKGGWFSTITVCPPKGFLYFSQGSPSDMVCDKGMYLSVNRKGSGYEITFAAAATNWLQTAHAWHNHPAHAV